MSVVYMKYVSVSVPTKLMDRVAEEVEHGNHGYTSKQDFVKDAIRQHLIKLQGVGNGDNPNILSNKTNMENKKDV